MYFIAVACGLNIALDYIFIGACGMGPLGAALGTTLAQTFSVIISFAAIKRMNTGLKLTRNDFVPRKNVLGEIVKIGLPVAVQDGCIQIAFIIITVIANKRGVNDAGGSGCCGEDDKLYLHSSIVNARHSIGTCRTEYWRRKA